MMPQYASARISRWFFVLFLATTALPIQAKNKSITIAFAGSMGALMNKKIGPSFATQANVNYRGIGEGAWALARLIASGRMQADVFISITPGPMKLLLSRGLINKAWPIASTQMVIAYNPRSRFASSFKAARHGHDHWYQILEKSGIKFGRTDPLTDPQGRNIIFTFLLAQRYYHQPHLAHQILGSWRNPAQIFSEGSLLARLEAGQLDATSGYLSAVHSMHLPYIRLPSPINLSTANQLTHTTRFKIQMENGHMRTFHPTPLIFYAAILKTSPHPGLARAFIRYLRSKAGQHLFKIMGYSPPHGHPLHPEKP